MRQKWPVRRHEWPLKTHGNENARRQLQLHLTSFQPVSSCASSPASSWLYLVISRARVRIMIMATCMQRLTGYTAAHTRAANWQGSGECNGHHLSPCPRGTGRSSPS